MESGSSFDDLCRICLKEKTSALTDMAEISKNSSQLSYSELIEQIFHINPDNDQIAFPRQICKDCVDDLEASYRFKMNCESAENLLHTYCLADPVGDDDETEIIEQIEAAEIDAEMQEEEDLFEETFETEDQSEQQAETIVLDKSGRLLKKEPQDVSVITIPATRNSTKVKSRGKREARQAQAGEAGKIHICEMCGNSYKYRHALEVHMRRHRGDRPFKCEYADCNRSFVIRFELKRHMRSHSGEKPYCCRYCERKFSDFGSRIKHERSAHTGERPYVCQTCGKSFAYSHVLSGHLLTHSGEKKYHCETCDKRFTKSHHLKSHLNTHLKASNKLAQAQAQQVAIETVNIVHVNSDELRHYQIPANN